MASPPTNPSSLTHNFDTAADGTKLSYYSIGSGPGIAIVHGVMCYALTYFTVHILSRRTRGLSGPYPDSITNCTTSACDKFTPPDENTPSALPIAIYLEFTPPHYPLRFFGSV